MIYFTSDWHIGHEAILDLCLRPYSRLKQMEKSIVRNYKEIVGNEDTCYFLGDIFWNKHKPSIEIILNSLPGNKILILGNHDHLTPFEYQDLGFSQVVTWLKLEEYSLVHDPAIAGCKLNDKFICGHVHGLFQFHKNVYNAGVDVNNFYPVDFNVIKNKFNIK